MPASVRSRACRRAPGHRPRGARVPRNRFGPVHADDRPVRAAGFTLVEAGVVLVLLGVAAALALPSVRSRVDGLRAVAAARHLAALIQSTRVRAVTQSVHVGLRFEHDGERYRYAMYADGDGDGLRARDIRSGVDARLADFERIGDRFPGVAIGIAARLPGIAGREALAAGSDPIRFGASDGLTFSPMGTATSGTLYLHYRSGRQLAVRVLGATGRVRILEFNEGTASWVTR